MPKAKHLPKRASFRGRSYRMVWAKPRGCSGWCDHPGKPNATIKIGVRQPPIMLLDLAIHEGLHACFPDTDEPAIAQTSDSIMKLLMRMGIEVQFTPEKKHSYEDWKPCVAE